MTAKLLYTREEAAEALNVCTKTLDGYRAKGLKYVRMGGRIMHRLADLERFIEQNIEVDECQSTSRKGRRTSTSISNSRVADFMGAQAKREEERRKRSNRKNARRPQTQA